MPLIVSPVTEQDLPFIVAIDHAAMSAGPLPTIRQSLCGFTSHTSYIQNIEATLRTAFANRDADDMHYYKVTDTDIIPPSSDPYNGIICFCVWKIHDITRSPSSTPTGKGTRAQPLRPGNFQSTSLARYVSQQADDFRAEWFPNESYLFFEMLMTAPAHQRRGAGKMLIQRALEMADGRGIKVTVGQGSEDGIGLYRKCGYVPVKEVLMDLRGYGVDEKPMRQWMLIRRVGGGGGGEERERESKL